MLIMYVSKVLLSVTMTESSRNLYFNFNTQQREIKQEKELEQCLRKRQRTEHILPQFQP